MSNQTGRPGSNSVYFNGYWYRPNIRGYMYNNTNGVLHRKVWECYNGPIPEGYDIHHKDGDKSNNNIDNLELLSHSEHAKHHNPLKQVVVLSEEEIRIKKEETRQRMSDSAKARGYSQVQIEAMRQSHLGTHLTDEHKAKVSQAHKGRVHTEQSRKNMSDAHKGKPSPKKIEPTQEMLDDLNKGIGCKDFMAKYNMSKGYFYNTKRKYGA